MPEEDLVELKFRLYDGTDIGPIQYAGASTVQMLKERILSEWPREKKIIPKTANDLRLISAGKILENSKTVAQCRVPFGELPGGVITMHVVVQPSLVKMKTAFAALCLRCSGQQEGATGSLAYALSLSRTGRTASEVCWSSSVSGQLSIFGHTNSEEYPTTLIKVMHKKGGLCGPCVGSLAS